MPHRCGGVCSDNHYYDTDMNKRLNKTYFYGTINHKEDGKRHIIKHYVFGEDFEHLKAFQDFCKENGYQIIHTPMEPSKSWRNVEYLKTITL